MRQIFCMCYIYFYVNNYVYIVLIRLKIFTFVLITFFKLSNIISSCFVYTIVMNSITNDNF